MFKCWKDDCICSNKKIIPTGFLVWHIVKQAIISRLFTCFTINSIKQKNNSADNYRKGVGTTVSSIILIIILIMFMIIYISMINENAKEKTYLNLRDAALLRMENTFYLVNTSLGTTWHISTAQSIFRTGDESIGCGYQDDRREYLTQQPMRDSYWYQTDPTRTKPTSLCNNPIPQDSKYNQQGCNPMICLPNADDNKYLLDYLNKKMKPYHDINLNFIANDINVTIADMDKDKIETVFSVGSEKITTATTQKIYMKDTWDTKLNANTRNDATIQTQMKKMVEAGEFIVKHHLLISNVFLADYRYKPETENAEKYKEEIKSLISTGLSGAEVAKFEYIDKDGNRKFKARIGIEYNAFELNARTLTEDPNYGDMVLHYDAIVKIIEGESIPTTDYDKFDWSTGPSPPGSRKISSCFGPRIPPKQGASGFHRAIDIVPNLNPDDNDPIMPAYGGKVVDLRDSCTPEQSCSGYGNYVLIEHEINNEIYYTFYGHLDTVNVGEGQDVDKNSVIGTMGTTGTSTGVHLHFEIWKGEKLDPCRFIRCSESTGIACKITASESDYEGYYYHDEEENKFVERPFSLVFGIEDYLPVIMCNRVGAPEYEFYTWKEGDDMACCGGMLWVCCNDGVCPDIPNLDKLTPDRKIPDGGKAIKCTTPLYEITCSNGDFDVDFTTIS